MRLDSTVSTATAKPGDAVVAHIVEPVRQGDRLLVPDGAEVRGRVVTAVRSGKVKGRARLVVEFDRLTLDGRPHEIAATPIDITAEDSKKRDAAIIGGAAGAGAIIGAIADGGKGAAIGGAVGRCRGWRGRAGHARQGSGAGDGHPRAGQARAERAPAGLTANPAPDARAPWACSRG